MAKRKQIRKRIDPEVHTAMVRVLDSIRRWDAPAERKRRLMGEAYALMKLMLLDARREDQMEHCEQMAASINGAIDAGADEEQSRELFRHIFALLIMIGFRPPVVMPRPDLVPHRRGKFGMTYLIRRRSGVEQLVEHRAEAETAKRCNFYVSRSDYVAATRAMAEVREPIGFQQLHDLYVKHGGRNLRSGFPLRVVLRFWRALDPPLIQRRRARYSPAIEPSVFEDRANEAWRSIGGS